MGWDWAMASGDWIPWRIATFCRFLAVVVAQMYELTCAVILHLFSRPPPPAQVLRLAPPHSHVPRDSWILLPGGTRAETAPLCDAIVAELERQLASGTQVGTAVVVFWHGQLVANVCGGVFRAAGCGWRGKWEPVTPDTLFMGYSVVKGVAATCLMTCVDRGEVDYQQPVSKVWPGFGGGGKRHVRVADAISHRAGLSNLPLAVIPSLLLVVSESDSVLDGMPRGDGRRDVELCRRRSWKTGVECMEQVCVHVAAYFPQTVIEQNNKLAQSSTIHFM